MTMFKKATKALSKLRAALIGPSGSGKTLSALKIALGLVGPEGRIAVLDTENGSASKYADLIDFDVVELEPPYHPDRYVKVIESAAAEGYDVLIIDSLSHAWKGKGGVLELVDKIAKRNKGGNSFRAWADADPIYQRFVEAIVRADIHIIGTMRSKTEYVVEDSGGRMKPRKIGTAPIQRDGFEYEFDVVAELDLDHNLIISKTRCMALDGEVFEKPGPEVGGVLRDWLSDGKPAEEIEKGAAPPAPESEPNGDGAPTPKRKRREASDKQVNYIKGLVERKRLSEDEAKDKVAQEKIRGMIENGLTAAKASNLIERLEALPDLEKIEPGERPVAKDADKVVGDDTPPGPFDGIEFASKEAKDLAYAEGLTVNDLKGVEATGVTGYTKGDVEGAVKLAKGSDDEAGSE